MFYSEPTNLPCLPDFETFERRFTAAKKLKQQGKSALLPVCRRLLSDTLTPVLAYHRLTAPILEDRVNSTGASYLFESVVGGDRVGRYSFLGTNPAMQFTAHGQEIFKLSHEWGTHENYFCDDPLAELQKITENFLVEPEAYDMLPVKMPGVGGWVGYAGYDTIRYSEGESLPNPPADDRLLPDLSMHLYLDTVVFDHVQKTLYLVTHLLCEMSQDADGAYDHAKRRLDELTHRLLSPDKTDAVNLPPGHVNLGSPPPKLPTSNMGEGGYQRAVETSKEYIKAGDAFQVVPSQRFELKTKAHPFDIYRALRVVNPSPYMFYFEFGEGVLVGSSPEILVNVTDGLATSRPLAGTRHRGATPEEDQRLADELVNDPKDRSEHIMLVDLHRNDIGRIAAPGSVELPELLAVEKYSHVMHLSSTVQGKLREGLTAWDALRVSLPVGTVSGAPKVRAMQIIDDLEPNRRGPYGGAVGYADFAGNMDMCIALRTMVILPQSPGVATSGRWTVHIQAGAGIVADSDPDAEHQETVNKAAALAKAVEVAEHLFT